MSFISDLFSAKPTDDTPVDDIILDDDGGFIEDAPGWNDDDTAGQTQGFDDVKPRRGKGKPAAQNAQAPAQEQQRQPKRPAKPVSAEELLDQFAAQPDAGAPARPAGARAPHRSQSGYTPQMPRAPKPKTEARQPDPDRQPGYTATGDKVYSVNATARLSVMLTKPTKYADAKIIGRKIKQNIICVLNLEALPKEEAKRILDFLSGYVDAIDGRIRKIARSTFILAPYDINVIGDLLYEIENNGAYFL